MKEVEQFVREKLKENWGSEQIGGYAKRHQLFSISHKRIYQFILADKGKSGQLYKHLRHHSWGRGLNENINGLIRQYIPKGKDFAELTDADIITIQEKLNNHPRKSLGYATPNEVFLQFQKTS